METDSQKIDRLTAQVARLTQALREIADGQVPSGSVTYAQMVLAYQDYALAALEAEE